MVSIVAAQPSYLAKRFLAGTLLVESIINQLGCFSLKNGHWSWFPSISFFPQLPSANKPRKVIGYSPSQARLLSLLLSSCLHAMFFIMMGSKGGYWVLFCAYALAAFARSILTGKVQFFCLNVLPHLKENFFLSMKRPCQWFLSILAAFLTNISVCIDRNAYFASGFKQSLGYAFGIWSASPSDILETWFLTMVSFRSWWSCISPRLSGHYFYWHSLVPLLFRFFDPLGLQRSIPSDDVHANYNGVFTRSRKCIDSGKTTSKMPRSITYRSYATDKQARVGDWGYPNE